jgi:hypothetical protein
MDDMFFRNDGKSLKRGQRRDKRTETCRPCRVWRADDPDGAMEGVVMDVNKYGMRIRMLDDIEVDTVVHIQLMVDEEFKEAMAPPMEARIARCIPDGEGFVDHGIQILRREIRREESKPIVVKKRAPLPPTRRTRMHTLDITVGDRGSNRGRR